MFFLKGFTIKDLYSRVSNIKNVSDPMSKNYRPIVLPFLIGLTVSTLLYTMIIPWWGFLVIFPWIGLSLSIGTYIRKTNKGKKRLLGRKVSLLMILPILLLFVPIVNNENFQMEGVVLIVLVGFFNKGFIHYVIAKLFGPLIWQRGFCGHACWTAAVLDWLPVGINNDVPRKYRNLRYISLLISVAIPTYMVFVLSYDPYADYISQKEMVWMFLGNAVYYAVGIPMAFILNDKRAFCKYACPVSLVMKPASSVGMLKLRPALEQDCTGCGVCNSTCSMGVDIKSFMMANQPVTDTECIMCNDCQAVCPTSKIVLK